MKRTMRIELDVTVYLSGEPDGTPEHLISATADWISGMLRIEADRIAESKNAVVGDFVHWIDE